MTRPTFYLLRMILFLVAVAAIVWMLRPVLLGAFGNNRPLNTLILLVLLGGIVWNFVGVARLSPEVRWIEAVRQPRAGLTPPASPRLLAPMASMLAARNREQRLQLSTPAARSLLDSLAARLDESREVSRYLTGLLIFLGLLGTFYGLILTVGSVGDVIGGMTIGNGDANAMFDQLKRGLARPLHGMGTAFSGSMFGLAGALVLGFLDLTAGQAQTRFFNELEEWLASVTRFQSGTLSGDGEAPIPAYVGGLLEQTAENLEALHLAVGRNEDNRARVGEALVELAHHMAGLGEMMRANQVVLTRIADAERSRGEAMAEFRAELRGELRLIARTLGARPPATPAPPP